MFLLKEIKEQIFPRIKVEIQSYVISTLYEYFYYAFVILFYFFQGDEFV